MKHEYAIEWVKALRSGEYPQGTTRLLDLEGKYCCLGVLCEINKAPKMESSKGYKFYDCEYGAPLEIHRLTGLRTAKGEIYNKGINLANLNDTGASFFEIADLIETYWREL